MFKITSCSASCFPEKCHYCQLFHKTNKPVNEIYLPSPSQWKHSRIEVLPSFLLLTGTAFVALRRVKIRNTLCEGHFFTALVTAIPGLLLIQGLPNGRISVFSYEPFFIMRSEKTPARPAGRAGTAKGCRGHPSGGLQAHHPPRCCTQDPGLHKNMCGKIMDSFNYLRLI